MTTFGNQLKYFRLRTSDPKTGRAITQERLAELLEEELDLPGYNNKLISRWERNKQHIDVSERTLLLGLIMILTKYGGIQTPGEADTWLESGGYRPITFQECCQIAGFTDQVTTQFCSDYQGEAPLFLDLEGLRTELTRIVLGEEDDVLAKISWSGRGLALFRRLVNWSGARVILTILLLATISTILILPYWQQLVGPLTERLFPLALFLSGSLVVPFLITMTTDPDQLPGEPPYRSEEFWRLFFLKWTGAVVGFGTFLGMFILAGFIFFPLGWTAILPGACFFFSLFGVIFGRMMARQAPANRVVMFGRPLRLHSADRLFFTVFLVSGVLFALLVEMVRDFLFNHPFGALPLVISLIILLIWLSRSQGG